MAEKSYLKNQIKLISLNANDTFTEDEHNKYMEVIEFVNEIDRLDTGKDPQAVIRKRELIAKKKKASEELTKLISEHKGYPRKVRLESVIHHKKDEDTPPGVTWRNLKLSKKIAEFESEMSRAMGLKANDYTFDKIIVKWKNLDLLEQLVMDGFTMDILVDGKIIQKKYLYFSSSAGQLRTDKCAFISEDEWDRIKTRLECGMDWDTINARGGVNVNKMLAYWSLCSSASIPWPQFDIDRCIVIPDFQAEVTDRMLYIKPDYTIEDGIKTVMINHTDGAGMYLPTAEIVPENLLGKNFMFRGPTFKGLLSPYDYIEFCKVHNVKPVIKDFWQTEHDLVAENIQIIFCDSQFKLAKLYPNWQSFKDDFKRCQSTFNIAQFEEDEPPDKTMNYQFLQSCESFTDEEIKTFTERTHTRIQNLATNPASMLEILKAGKKASQYDKAALAYYPELLRDGYTRQQLKDIKKRMLLDAKSGTIRCKNKRLYVIPDWFAACQSWFLGIDRPSGLLKAREIACRPYLKYDKADVLRSPSLYMEHFVAEIVKDPEIYKWLNSDGVYTSVKSMVSRILQ